MANNMAALLRNVIRNGGMPLAQVSERIETMYLTGRISGGEREELTALMHEKASPENEKGGWQELYEALAVKYSELEKRVKALEGVGAEDETGGEEEIPEWQAWDGVSAGYRTGDRVRHNGEVWENMLEGMDNVWEPGAPGVDERYWRGIDEEEAIRMTGK